MEGNAIQRLAVSIFMRFDFNTIWVVRAYFVQRNNMRDHQAQQDQRYRNDVEAEETVQCGIAHHKIAADQQGQVRSHKRNRCEQVHNHLRTPVAHLAPRQQVAHEGLSHQAQENCTTENPNQLTRLTVTAVQQTTEHVHVHHNKKRRSACGVHVTD